MLLRKGSYAEGGVIRGDEERRELLKILPNQEDERKPADQKGPGI